MTTWYKYLNDKTYLEFPTFFEPYRVFRYNQSMKQFDNDHEALTITDKEYSDKKIDFAEKNFGCLTTDEISYFEDHYNQPKSLYIIRGEQLFDQKEYQNAIKDFNKVIELTTIKLDNTLLAEAYLYRGRCKMVLEDYYGAIQDFDKCIKFDIIFKREEVYFSRGYTRYYLKNYLGAIDDYNKYLLVNPKDEEAYYNRGCSKYLMKNTKGACADWSKAGELGNEKAYEKIKEYCK